LYLDKVKGLLSEIDYVEFLRDFTSEKARLERLVTDCQEQLGRIEKRLLTGENRRLMI
jgi:hypothetical protein